MVANAAKLVGKKVKARVTRVLPGTAYATVVSTTKDGAVPITAESEAEKPTRKPAAKKGGAEADADLVIEDEDAEGADDVEGEGEAQPKKKTRRGSRGGKRRKKAPTIHVPGAELGTNGDEAEPAEAVAAVEPVQPEQVAEAPPEGESEAPKKRKTRRGSRGGRNRRKKPPAAAPAETSDSG